MRRTEKWPQYIASIILSFLSFIFLLGSISLALLSGTLFSENYYLRQVDEGKFASTALYELHTSYRSYAAASGVDAEVMESLVDEQRIRAALSQKIRTIFSDAEQYDYEAFAIEVEETLLDYALRQEGALDGPELREGIKQLVLYTTGSFVVLTDSLIFDMLGSYAVASTGTISQFVWILAGAAIVSIGVMIIMLGRLSLILRNLVYTLGALLISVILIPVTIQATGFLQRVNISPPSMKQYLTACLGGFFNAYWVVCAVVAVLLSISVLMLLLRQRAKKQAKRRRAHVTNAKEEKPHMDEENKTEINLGELNPSVSEFFLGELE